MRIFPYPHACQYADVTHCCEIGQMNVELRMKS
jgi:hypothetical protein